VRLNRFHTFEAAATAPYVLESEPHTGLVVHKDSRNGADRVHLVMYNFDSDKIEAYEWLDRDFKQKDWESMRTLGTDKKGPLILDLAMSVVYPEWVVPDHMTKERALEYFRKCTEDKSKYEYEELDKEHRLWQKEFWYDVNHKGKSDDLWIINSKYRIKKPVAELAELTKRSNSMSERERGILIRRADKEFERVYISSI